MKARMKFRKWGSMKYVGHLDMMRFFQKALRRAEIPVAFSGGYSPHMILSFAQPLGLGITSDGEYMDLEFCEGIVLEEADLKETVQKLNQVMVDGVEVVSLVVIDPDKKRGGMTIVAAASYQVRLLASLRSLEEALPFPETWQKALPDFLGQKELPVWKKTKSKETLVDIRPMIYQMEMEEEKLCLFLAAGSNENLKPELVMKTFLEYLGEGGEYFFSYHRTDLYARTENGFCPLDSLEYREETAQ